MLCRDSDHRGPPPAKARRIGHVSFTATNSNWRGCSQECRWMSWARSWPRAGSLFISLKLLRAAIRWVSNRDAIVLHHLLAKIGMASELFARPTGERMPTLPHNVYRSVRLSFCRCRFCIRLHDIISLAMLSCLGMTKKRRLNTNSEAGPPFEAATSLKISRFARSASWSWLWPRASGSGTQSACWRAVASERRPSLPLYRARSAHDELWAPEHRPLS